MTTGDFLLALPDHRRRRAQTWLAGNIGDCVDCGQPIVRTDTHQSANGGFRHLTCDSAALAATDPSEAISKNVEANARRADWG